MYNTAGSWLLPGGAPVDWSAGRVVRDEVGWLSGRLSCSGWG